MRDSDRPMTQREAYQRGYAAGYAAAQSGPPDHQPAATPSVRASGPSQEGAGGSAADPLADLCERLRDNTRNQYGRELDRKEAADALERLRAERDEAIRQSGLWESRAADWKREFTRADRAESERDTLAAIVRAADAMRAVAATRPDGLYGGHQVAAYDRARAKWEGKP